MPSFTQFLCDPCYKEFNYDVFGKKIFDFKAAPCYDRRNRRAGVSAIYAVITSGAKMRLSRI